MKLKKLYTSIGFGLYLKSLTTKEFCQLSGAKELTVIGGVDDFFRIDAVMLRMRNDYDKYLLQAPDKCMFVNEFDKPLECYSNIGGGVEKAYYMKLEWWQEAEKKVIFEGWSNESNNNVIEKESFRKYETITFYKDYAQYNIEDNGSDYYFDLTTLSDLAEATKSTLDIKNVEI